MSVYDHSFLATGGGRAAWGWACACGGHSRRTWRYRTEALDAWGHHFVRAA